MNLLLSALLAVSPVQEDRKGPVQLTSLPMRIEDLERFIPYGLMVGSHVTPIDHAYFVPKKSERDAFEVYAPADGWIVSIQHRTGYQGTDESGKKKPDEYRIFFEHTRTFSTYYDLVTKLDDAIVKALGGPMNGGPTRRCRIAVKSGQVIGRIGGQTLDFGVVDQEVTRKGFLVPKHYEREPWKIHTVDPLECFEPELKEKLLAINPRKAEPRGGKIDYDVDGRLVGNWFLENTNGYAGAGDRRGYWTGHLAFAYHHIDPTKIMVSMGDYDGRTAQFFVKGNAPDPASVSKKVGRVSYELVAISLTSDGRAVDRPDDTVRGVVLVELLEDRRIRFEAFPGKAAKDVDGFTKNARVFER